MPWLASVVRGHMAYYAVPGNIHAVAAFRDQVTRHWRRALRRRSQKTRINWARINRIAARWLPPVRVMHPYPEARFAANFTKLGFHPGFGLTATLPELVGKNNAELIFYTSRRIGGEEATRMGLANVCVAQDQVRSEALKLASEIAEVLNISVRTVRRGWRSARAWLFREINK